MSSSTGNMPPIPATAATTIGSYKDIKVEKIDDYTVKVHVRQADAVLGRRLRRHARHDHPEASVRGLQGRQIARRAGQSEAGRHRPLPLRRLQARRHRARASINTDYHMAEPALFRHDRDEGRRRRGFGGARRDADRRIRLRLEHAGRGRDPDAAGEGRQGQASTSRRAATSSTSSSTPPTRGPRSTASGPASRPSIRCFSDPAVRQALALLVDRNSVEKYIYGRTGIATATSSTTRSVPLEEHEMGVQHREGQPAARGGRLEARAPTASAPRTARSSNSSTRRRSTRRARRPRRSSSRPARRPASRSSSSR